MVKAIKFPPSPEMVWKNKDRVRAASQALAAYLRAKREKFEDGGVEVQDLISDLLHYAARNFENVPKGIDQILRLARMNFEAEHGNPEEE